MSQIRRYVIPVIATVAGAIFGFIVISEVDRLRSPEIVILDPLPDSEIAVVVDGAVATPGVYRVSGDSRVVDILEMAGGELPDADLALINLAERVRDAQKFTIPTLVPEDVAMATSSEESQVTASQPLSLASRPLNINVATVTELESLPGIGPAIAQMIVERRDSTGPFESVEELAEISGISERMVDELRNRITVE